MVASVRTEVELPKVSGEVAAAFIACAAPFVGYDAASEQDASGSNTATDSRQQAVGG